MACFSSIRRGPSANLPELPNDSGTDPVAPLTWRTHAHLLLAAWLNAEVYQPASLGRWLAP